MAPLPANVGSGVIEGAIIEPNLQSFPKRKEEDASSSRTIKWLNRSSSEHPARPYSIRGIVC